MSIPYKYIKSWKQIENHTRSTLNTWKIKHEYILSFPRITFGMIQFKAIFAYKFVAFHTIVWCFFYAHIFHFFSCIHKSHNIFLRHVSSLGNAFPLKALHSFLLVVFHHRNMKSEVYIVSWIFHSIIVLNYLIWKVYIQD